jgi:4-hydroxymandelate oxidase
MSDVKDGDETMRGDATDGPASDVYAASAASDLVCLDDYEHCARARMTPAAAGFLASGVGDEITVHANREAFTRIRLRPRALVDVSRLDTRVRLLGRDHALPIVLAPTAYTGVFHSEGERAVARGARDAGVTYTVASFSTTAIEDIRAESAGALWFQLYMLSDRGLMREIMARAEAAGCEAFCLTVDHPVPGARNQERRARFELPNGLRRVHLDKLGDAAGRLGRPVAGGRDLYNPLMDATVTWKDAEALVASTRLPVLMKGILDADDAERAIAAGAAGIIVSNHGGRTVDQLPATLDALPAIVERVARRVPVLIDGGIRRGTDIVIARAMGADAILIGRPYVHGLALAGAAGVTQVVNILRQELEMALALLGRTSLDQLDRSVLWST